MVTGAVALLALTFKHFTAYGHDVIVWQYRTHLTFFLRHIFARVRILALFLVLYGFGQ